MHTCTCTTASGVAYNICACCNLVHGFNYRLSVFLAISVHAVTRNLVHGLSVFSRHILIVVSRGILYCSDEVTACFVPVLFAAWICTVVPVTFS